MECRKDLNLKNCTCTYSCSNRGMCCQCVSMHRSMGEIPGCFFPADGEKTYDRTIANFIKYQQK